MKKLIYLSIFSAIVTLSACNVTTKTGGAVSDSGSHGSAGPVDTSKAAGAGITAGASTTGSDTSTNGKTTANPTVDTVKKKP